MRVNELNLPALEAQMQGLLQRPTDINMQDLHDLLDITLRSIIRVNLKMSNQVIVALGQNVKNVGLTLPLDDYRRESLVGWAEMLQEVFDG